MDFAYFFANLHYPYRTRNLRHGHSTHVLQACGLGNSSWMPVDGTSGGEKMASGAAAEEVREAANGGVEQAGDGQKNSWTGNEDDETEMT